MKIRIEHNSTQVADAIAKAPDVVLPEIDKAMKRGADEIADQQKADAPKFRSHLSNSIQVAAQPLLYTITAAEKHGEYVERGTGMGGRPKLTELLAWIKLKGIAPRDPTMTALGLAFVIRRKIATSGIRAQPFFYKAYEKKASRLTELLESAANAGLAKVFT